LRTGLDEVDPGGDLEFTRTLQVGRVCGDESLGTVGVTGRVGRGKRRIGVVWVALMN
jgi:hypothetical protein